MSLEAGLRWRAAGTSHRKWIGPIAASVALVVLTTAVLWQIEAQLNLDHLIFIYFLPTTFVAVRYGSLSAMGVTIACAVMAAFFLYPPRLSFLIASPLDVLELVLFSLLALLAIQVVSGFANDRDVEKRRQRRNSRMLAALWQRTRPGS